MSNERKSGDQIFEETLAVIHDIHGRMAELSRKPKAPAAIAVKPACRHQDFTYLHNEWNDDCSDCLSEYGCSRRKCISCAEEIK